MGERVRVRWQRARDGFVYSHCGRWRIVPLYCGGTRPELFDVYLDDRKVGSWCSTQKEAKEEAERIAVSLSL